MLQFNAVGTATEDGKPVVVITMTVTIPLESADEVYKIIRKGGTQSVLAVGAWNEQRVAMEKANSEIVGP